jgi:hypothetical protein
MKKEFPNRFIIIIRKTIPVSGMVFLMYITLAGIIWFSFSLRNPIVVLEIGCSNALAFS